MLDLSYKLSEHFTFEMLTITDIRTLLEANRLFGVDFIKPLSDLCNLILEPIYNLIAVPKKNYIHIVTGYRYPILNTAVGSLTTSRHQKGEVVDFIISGIKLDDIFNQIRFSNIPFGELRIELNSWIHISIGEPYLEVSDCRKVFYVDSNHYRKT